MTPPSSDTRAAELRERYSKRKGIPRIVWPIIMLAMLLLFNMLFTPNFAKIELKDGHLFGSLIDIVRNVAPVIIIAAGMTLVIATGGVDLSVGAVMAIAGALAAKLLVEHDMSLPMVIIIVLLAGLLAGAWNGILVAVGGVQPIVATLILMVAGRGIAQMMTKGQIPQLDTFITFCKIGNGFFLMLPISLTLVAVVYIITGLVTRRTAAGLFIEATGGNPSASHYCGVNIHLVKIFAYSMCGLWAALAGIIAASDIKAADANNAGLYLELDAILAVVIGGTALTGGRFSLLGSIIGALIIQTLTSMILTRGIKPEYTRIVKAIVVLIACLVQSEVFRQKLRGIFASRKKGAP